MSCTSSRKCAFKLHTVPTHRLTVPELKSAAKTTTVAAR